MTVCKAVEVLASACAALSALCVLFNWERMQPSRESRVSFSPASNAAAEGAAAKGGGNAVGSTAACAGAGAGAGGGVLPAVKSISGALASSLAATTRCNRNKKWKRGISSFGCGDPSAGGGTEPKPSLSPSWSSTWPLAGTRSLLTKVPFAELLSVRVSLPSEISRRAWSRDALLGLPPSSSHTPTRSFQRPTQMGSPEEAAVRRCSVPEPSARRTHVPLFRTGSGDAGIAASTSLTSIGCRVNGESGSRGLFAPPDGWWSGFFSPFMTKPPPFMTRPPFLLIISCFLLPPWMMIIVCLTSLGLSAGRHGVR